MVATGRTQVVVITGASAGVGRATAIEFARRGARIAVLARGEAGLAGAARDIEAAGGRALALPVDVADFEQVERAAQVVEERFGPIDIWINNAMVSVFSPVLEMAPEEFRRVTDVTYLGAVHGTMAALHRMRPRNRGVIIQVGSALAYRGIPLQSAYCAAKHAVQGFTESLRSELIHDRSRVRLSMVQLPAMNTPQFDWVRSRLPRRAQPVPPIFEPEIAADAIVYLARHYRRELYIGYPTVKAIIGNKLFPGYADRYLAKFGYEAQMTREPENPGRPDNLYRPLGGDHGARGRFTDRACSFSLQAWLNTHRAVASAAALAAVLVISARRSSIRPSSQSLH